MKFRFLVLASFLVTLNLSAQDSTGVKKQEPKKTTRSAKKSTNGALVDEKIAVSDESKPVKKSNKKKAPAKKTALDEK